MKTIGKTSLVSLTALTGLVYIGSYGGTFLLAETLIGGVPGYIGGGIPGVRYSYNHIKNIRAELQESDDDLAEIVVDPNRINNLVIKARMYEREKERFQVTHNWQ